MACTIFCLTSHYLPPVGRIVQEMDIGRWVVPPPIHPYCSFPPFALLLFHWIPDNLASGAIEKTRDDPSTLCHEHNFAVAGWHYGFTSTLRYSFFPHAPFSASPGLRVPASGEFSCYSPYVRLFFKYPSFCVLSTYWHAWRERAIIFSGLIFSP